MHAAAFSPRGTARKAASLRGQSIIEYVLIIAIIGLVVVFAGPGVAGAIRNQFNQVTNTVNSGTSGGSEGGGASGGGSAGDDSATVQAAVAKDAKDWTLDEQKAVAEDIAAKGEASPAYAKAEAAMKAGTTWSVKLTKGAALEYRIVGIDHDDLADGSGKAGLTFEATNNALSIGGEAMNFTNKNAGGWEASNLRNRLNSLDLWALLPSELQSKMKAVTKMTDNKGGGSADIPSATTDKVFLLSATEVYGNFQSDGTQYEFYKSKGVTSRKYNGASSKFTYHWTRSVSQSNAASFYYVCSDGSSSYGPAFSSPSFVFPAWCF